MSNICSAQPVIQGLFHPIGHGHSSNVSALTNKVHDGPMIFPTLNVVKHQISQLSTTQTTTKQHCQDSAIPLALKSVHVGKLPQRAGFFYWTEPLT